MPTQTIAKRARRDDIVLDQRRVRLPLNQIILVRKRARVKQKVRTWTKMDTITVCDEGPLAGSLRGHFREYCGGHPQTALQRHTSQKVTKTSKVLRCPKLWPKIARRESYVHNALLKSWAGGLFCFPHIELLPQSKSGGHHNTDTNYTSVTLTRTLSTWAELCYAVLCYTMLCYAILDKNFPYKWRVDTNRHDAKTTCLS